MWETDIAVVGSTTVDRIVQGGAAVYKTGGVTAYSGITYKRNGMLPRILSNVSHNDLEILDPLCTENLVVCMEHATSTTCFEHVLRSDTPALRLLSRAAPISYDHVSAVLDRVRFVHLGPLHPSDVHREAVTALNRTGLVVVLDVQGYVRRIEGTAIRPGVAPILSDALAVSHVVKANARELAHVLRFYGMTPAGLLRAFEIGELVVTSGGEGGFIHGGNGEEHRFAAHPVGRVSDPTGAGDVFLASYVVWRHVRGRTVDEACRYAAEAAARQVQGTYITDGELVLKRGRGPGYSPR